MWNLGRFKIYLDEVRAWGGLILAALSVVVFLGSLGSAQAAPLPRAFVELLVESRPGRTLLMELEVVGRIESRTGEALVHALETQRELRSLRDVLQQRAALYGAGVVEFRAAEGIALDAAIERSALSEAMVTRLAPSARARAIARAYESLTGADREFLLEAMNGLWGRNISLLDISEYLHADAIDFVGLRRLMN